LPGRPEAQVLIANLYILFTLLAGGSAAATSVNA